MTLQLHGRELTLAALAREIPCALIAIDGDERVTLWNAAAEGMTGYDAGIVTGRNWRRLLGIKVDDSGQAITIRRRDGREISVRERPAPSFAPEGGRALFLEHVENLLDAAKRVVQDVLQLLPAYFSI